MQSCAVNTLGQWFSGANKKYQALFNFHTPLVMAEQIKMHQLGRVTHLDTFLHTLLA